MILMIQKRRLILTVPTDTCMPECWGFIMLMQFTQVQEARTTSLDDWNSCGYAGFDLLNWQGAGVLRDRTALVFTLLPTNLPLGF